MTISATMIADSVNPEGIRLRTFQLRYPRFIHAEFMTHRVFSRNASSSRAVPVAKLIEDVITDPVNPTYWGMNQPGMQAIEELDEVNMAFAKAEWNAAREYAIKRARGLAAVKAHKQIANRVLEPYSHINVVCTATDYENFYALRRHPDAQPEIKALADAMWECEQASTPLMLHPGQWHLPYFGRGIWLPNTFPESLEVAQKVSVARCARVSYLTHDGRDTTVEEDAALFDRLVGGMPLHATPAEHQATPDRMAYDFKPTKSYVRPHEHGNLRGYRQLRKTLSGEFTPG